MVLPGNRVISLKIGGIRSDSVRILARKFFASASILSQGCGRLFPVGREKKKPPYKFLLDTCIGIIRIYKRSKKRLFFES